MYLSRIGPVGLEHPAVQVGPDAFIDVSDVVGDFDEAFFAGGGPSLLRDTVAAREAEGATSPLEGRRIGAPIVRPHQIVGIGLNYRDHAIEAGMAIPAEPIVFTKSPNTLVGPYDDVRIPRGSTRTDWEVELGVVVGRGAATSGTRRQHDAPSRGTCSSTTSASGTSSSSAAVSG